MVRPELDSAARQLQWMALFQAGCWSAVAVALVGAHLTGMAGALGHALEPRNLDWLFSPAPFLYVFALVPSALATSFAQGLRRALSAGRKDEPAVIAFLCIVAPFIVPAVIYGRLDRALVELAPDVPRTRGAWFALMPLWLLLGGVFIALVARDHASEVAVVLFSLSRTLWGVGTMRTCRAIRLPGRFGTLRAHGDAPVAGG